MFPIFQDIDPGRTGAQESSLITPYMNYLSVKPEYRRSEYRNVDELKYLDLLNKIIKLGHFRETRNAKVYSLAGQSLTFDLSENKIPLLTTKVVPLFLIFKELMFFISGRTDTKTEGLKIWEKNTSKEFLEKNNLNYPEGHMGPMYGWQWRTFGKPYVNDSEDYNQSKGIKDQLQYCINLLINDPYSRRILMTTYNPLQAFDGCLFPCHGICTQFVVEQHDNLVCIMTQRSADCFLGLPFNIASYALLTKMICYIVNNDKNKKVHLYPTRLVIHINDAHVYSNHLDQCNIQVKREPFSFPKLFFKGEISDISDFKFDNILVKEYNSYPAIKAEMIA